MVDWREFRVRELVADGVVAVSDGYRMRNEELGARGIPFVRGGDIGEGSVNTETVDHIRPEFANRVQAKLARPGDVAFITKGNVGRTGFLRIGQPEVVFAPQVAYWRSLDHEVLDPRFLFYLLGGRDFQANLDAVKTHGAMAADYVSISQQHEFRVCLPPIVEQRRIARILASLDDKIELNRRMNETLEAMARALFKSWFVDFDPVRAKAEGRAPAGMDAATSALFPSRLVETAKGEVPEGWSIAELGEVADLNPESWARNTYPSAIRYVDLAAAKWGTISDIGNFARDAAPSRAQRILRRGDTIVGTVRPGNGSYALVDEDGLTGSTGFAVLRARHLSRRAVVYLAATARENIDRLAHFADGGAYPAVRPELVGATPLVECGAEVGAAFECLVGPLLDRASAARKESAVLAAIRDALLPRLLSGEVRVDTRPITIEDAA